jgi:hypothetical protein
MVRSTTTARWAVTDASDAHGTSPPPASPSTCASISTPPFSQGFEWAKIRTISDNARTLKFEQSGFEEG